MAINRTHMRRQLYRGGGIADIYPRQGFGLGSKIKERIRKLIPNELADVAVKAAPFVAPFNPGIAGMMRGIGRFDQRGSISDALKQGLLTTGLGAGARYLGGAEQVMGGGLEGGFTSPLSESRTEGLRNLFRGEPQVEGISKNIKGNQSGSWDTGKWGPTPGTQGTTDKLSLKGIMDKWTGMNPQLRTAIVGVGSGALAGFAQWAENQIPQEPGEDMTAYLARRNVAVGELMLQYMDNTRAFDAEWTGKTLEQKKAEIAQLNYNQGGRVGLFGGGEAGIKSLDAGAPDITYEGNEGPKAPQQMAFDDTPGFELKPLDLLIDEFKEDNNGEGPKSIDDLRRFFYIKYGPKGIAKVDQATKGKQMAAGPVLPSDEDPINPFAPEPTGPVLPDKQMAAQGGRIGYAAGSYDEALTLAFKLYKEKGGTMSIEEFADAWAKEKRAKGGRIGYNIGTDPRALMGAPGLAGMQSAPRSTMDPRGLRGLPGIPQMAPDGLEFDMRENGGFQGLGAKEGKDDVNAKLAKNEFVFTADAVRGAGGGDIELGAQKMYDTMKNLEKRVV